MAALCNRLLLALLSLCLVPWAGADDGFIDPLDRPASQVGNLLGAQFNAITTAGERLVAVGARGLIAVSDDAGSSWKQMASPVSSDLLAVYFPIPAEGWAVGHEGVVLHSGDRGKTWTKQLDGREAATLLQEHFEQRMAGGDSNAASYLDGVRLNYQDGPEQALMGVWFADAKVGYVAGTFGTLLATHDGGKTWESWMERVDNPELLHYLGISGYGNELFLSSERGIVYRLNPRSGRFETLETGYSGSFFSIKARPGAVIAVGLQGSAYRTLDQGATWVAMPTGISVALSDLQVAEEGRFIASSVDGRVLQSDVQLKAFKVVPGSRPGRFTSLVALPKGQAVTVGYSGVRQVALQ
ncbi:YCF48-related protein [Pseudomonas nitroreducens]|uniref:YCF48-related protein n=1 Tax=Pseudomonas nitroreducens TaxID=46680 RepID=UPI003CC82175